MVTGRESKRFIVYVDVVTFNYEPTITTAALVVDFVNNRAASLPLYPPSKAPSEHLDVAGPAHLCPCSLAQRYHRGPRTLGTGMATVHIAWQADSALTPAAKEGESARTHWHR